MRKHSTIDPKTLSSKEIAKISNIVFYAPAPTASDVMLVFGAPEGDWLPVANSYHQGLAKTIVVSGGIHERTHGRTEAVLIKEYLMSQNIPETTIIKEEKATNTLENVQWFKQVTDSKNIQINSILYHCLNFHAGRCFLTLRKYFPESIITATTHSFLFSGLNISRTNWHHDQEKASRVLGEYERIMEYSQKGDIAPPEAMPEHCQYS